MTSQNVENLLAYVLAHRVGTKFTCATSQYANNTTAPGFRFDTWSTAQAVRSLVKRGFIEAEYGWRYYDCKVIRHSEKSRFPVRVRMSAEALTELHSCEYGSYEDNIHSDGGAGEIREGEYNVREFGDHGDYRLHIIEILERDGYKTVVILKNQDELDEFFGQALTGTFGLYHRGTALRIYDDLIDLVSDDVRNAIGRYSIGF